MKIIKCLSSMIEDELHDAEKYASKALEYRESAPETAELFYKLSLEEMTHMSLLHTQVENLIAEYRRVNGDPPEKMLFAYELLHERMIEHAREVKVLQSMYKE